MNKVVMPNAIMLGEVSSMLEEGHSVVIPTKGNSMLPFIVGERDSVNLVKMQEVSVGDIVLARLPADHYVLHRVWAVDGGDVTLMGDGNLRGCETCRIEDIKGTAVQILKKKDKVVDCRSQRSLRQARIWRGLLPVRRWLLAIYRRTYLRFY